MTAALKPPENPRLSWAVAGTAGSRKAASVRERITDRRADMDVVSLLRMRAPNPMLTQRWRAVNKKGVRFFGRRRADSRNIQGAFLAGSAELQLRSARI